MLYLLHLYAIQLSEAHLWILVSGLGALQAEQQCTSRVGCIKVTQAAPSAA